MTSIMAQKAAVSEKVSLPLADPTGTNYSKKSVHFHMGYLMPVFNTNQHQTLFWNTGGFHLSIASQIAVNQRIGFGYQLSYQYMNFGQKTGDSLGTTFLSDKMHTSTNVLNATVFLRVFLGSTYFQPSIDIGPGIGWSFFNRFTHSGTYLPDNSKGELTHRFSPSQTFPASIFFRLNIQKFYVSATSWFKPLFIENNQQFQWKNQVGVGLRF